MRMMVLSTLLLLSLSSTSVAAPRERLFDDPMFRRCVSWMLSGQRGALIEDVCLDEYEIRRRRFFFAPARSKRDSLRRSTREGCAIIYEEQIKKVRAGYIRRLPASED